MLGRAFTLQGVSVWKAGELEPWVCGRRESRSVGFVATGARSVFLNTEPAGLRLHRGGPLHVQTHVFLCSG